MNSLKENLVALSTPALNHEPDHIRLFIPGPTEVRPKILAAQTRPMIGHRMPECADLIGSIHPKLQQVFMTKSRVLINASSGTGMLEAAVRNLVGRKVLNCINGAFSKRQHEIAVANGKACEVVETAWGQAIVPEMVLDKLATGEFDTITMVHNETSTGVTNPIKEIAAAIRNSFEQRFWPLFQSGQLQTIIDTTFPIEEAQAAHDYVAQDKNIGKVVLVRD